MIRAGFTFEHPKTKTRTVVLESDAETNGMGWLLEVTRYLRLGSDLGEHMHLTWLETFEIIKGSAKYKLDGVEKIINAGESFVVEPGHYHVHPWNATKEELVYRQRDVFAKASPAAVQDILGIFATATGMAADGSYPKTKSAKLFQEAVTLKTAVKHGNYMATPSMFMQKVIGSTLGLLGELLGYRAVHAKYVGE